MPLHRTPPITPSKVFLGLIFGQSGVFPKNVPTKYAPESASHAPQSVSTSINTPVFEKEDI